MQKAIWWTALYERRVLHVKKGTVIESYESVRAYV